MQKRAVKKHFASKTFEDDTGFKIRRPIGDSTFLSNSESDPFLMMDEHGPHEYEKGEFPGAPWHPHRGLDTVTYLKQGKGAHQVSFEHDAAARLYLNTFMLLKLQDSMGNSGVLEAGDCQWLTAGSGIEHTEGTDHPGGVLHAFQLWVNLPAAHKMDPPAYQDVSAATIPLVQAAKGVRAKVIAGECGGIKAVVQTLVPIQYIDFSVDASSSFAHPLPVEMETAIAYIYSGKGSFSNGESKHQAVKSGDCVLFADAGAVAFRASAGEGFEFLLLAGQKLREPVVWHGPLVMNSRAQIMEAFQE